MEIQDYLQRLVSMSILRRITDEKVTSGGLSSMDEYKDFMEIKEQMRVSNDFLLFGLQAQLSEDVRVHAHDRPLIERRPGSFRSSEQPIGFMGRLDIHKHQLILTTRSVKTKPWRRTILDLSHDGEFVAVRHTEVPFAQVVGYLKEHRHSPIFVLKKSTSSESQRITERITEESTEQKAVTS